MKIMDKISRFTGVFLYLLLTAVVGAVIGFSLTEPQQHLLTWQMTLGAAAGVLLFVLAFYVWERFIPEKWKESTPLYLFLLFSFGASLYIVSCLNQNIPESQVDYGVLLQSAYELAEGKPMSAEWYFKIYPNNFKPLLFLSALCRVSYFFRFKDPFYLILLVSVLEVLFAVWSVGILVGHSKKGDRSHRIPVLFMFVFLLPIWSIVQSFYTDSMSFCMAAAALALMKLSFETESKVKIYLLSAAAGIFAAVGISVKVTIMIPLIAGALVFLFFDQNPKRLPHIGICLLAACITYGSVSLWADTYEVWHAAKETGEPAIDWIALGMKGEGSYGDNLEYINYVKSLPTKAEKASYTKKYIWENRSDFFNAEHLVKKLRYNFASGGMGAFEYAYYTPDPERFNVIWEVFSPWGSYYWRTSQFCFCYLFALYILYFTGAIFSVVQFLRKKEISRWKMIADLTLLGIFLFLMLWEANNRQLYNQMPIFLLGGMLNLQAILAPIIDKAS